LGADTLERAQQALAIARELDEPAPCWPGH